MNLFLTNNFNKLGIISFYMYDIYELNKFE